MKKLYLLLVALIVATIPGVAQIWTITGSFNGWSEQSTYQFTQSTDNANVYILKMDNFAAKNNGGGSDGFKFKTCESGWAGDKNFGRGSDATINLNSTYQANTGNGGDNIYTAGEWSNVTIYLNLSNHKVLVANDSYDVNADTNADADIKAVMNLGGGDDPQPADKWYLIGELFGGWNSVDNQYQLTASETEEGIYTFDFTDFEITSAREFKFVAPKENEGAWSGKIISPANGQNTVTFNEEISAALSNEGGNFAFSSDYVGSKYTGRLTLDAKNYKFTFAADDVPVITTTWSFVIGDQSYEFDENLVLTIDAAKLSAGQFKIKKTVGTAETSYGQNSEGYKLDFTKTEYYLSPTKADNAYIGSDVMGFNGTVKITITNTAASESQIVIRAEKGEEIQEPLTYYFVSGDQAWPFVAEGARLAVRLEQMPATFHVELRKGSQTVTRWAQENGGSGKLEYFLGSYYSDYYLKPGGSVEGALAAGVNWQRVMVLITSTKANDKNELTISVLRDFIPSIASDSRWFLETEGVNALTEFRFGMAGHYLDYAEVPAAFRVVELKPDGTQVTYGTTEVSVAGGYETYLTAGARDAVGYIRTSTPLTNLSLVLSIVNDTQVALQSEALETLPITDELYILGNTFDYASHYGEEGFGMDNSGNVRWHANIGTPLTKIADGVFYGEGPDEDGDGVADGIEFYPSYSDDTHSVFSFVTKLASSADGWSEIENNRLGARIQRYDLAKIDGLRQSFKAYANENAILIEPGKYYVGVNLNTRTITIMKPNEMLDENDDLYIVGDLNYYWHFTRSVKMERTEDGGTVTYTADGFNLVPANAYWWNKDEKDQHVDYGRIMIVSKPVEDVLIDRGPSDEEIEAGRVAAPRRADEATQPAVVDHGLNGINLGTRYVIGDLGTEKKAALTPVIGGINDNIEPTQLPVGNYKFTITSDANGNKTLSLGDATVQTGVENVADDNADAPVEYYTLQGIRVANPSAGIYLRRQGTAVTKILVK